MASIQSEAWNVNGYPLVFKEWSPTVAEELDVVTHVPIWVLFPNLDPCFWSNSALSKVASFVGKLICADETTTVKSRIAFSRVLVVVDISKDLRGAVTLQTPFRGKILQKIDYEWVPLFCQTCHKIGHTRDRCKRNQVKQVYRPKVVAPTPAITEVAKQPSPDFEGFIPVPSKKMAKVAQQENVISIVENKFDVLENSALVLLQLEVDKGLVHVGFEMGNVPVEIEPSGIPPPPPFLPNDHFLLESHSINAIKRRFFQKYSLVTNLDLHCGDRLWVLWDPSVVTLRVLHRGVQFLHCSLLHIVTQRQFLVTFVYALNRASERLDLWDQLRFFSVGSLPWTCLGDFNVSLSSDERMGCVIHEPEMQEFRDCLRDYSLEDHPYTGGVFTWHNKQDSCPKWEKLDRLLANQQWFLHFPSTVAFLPPGISDRASILLTVASPGFTRKQFRYLNCWSSFSGFNDLVLADWHTPVYGSHIFALFSKLRRLRGVLKTIHATEFRGIAKRVADAKTRLSECQTLLLSSPAHQQLLAKEKSLLHSYRSLKGAEMRMLAQREKVQHLLQSDANTKYFYASIAARRSRNTIGAIEDMSGQLCSGHEEVSKAFLEFYTQLLGSTEDVSCLPADIFSANTLHHCDHLTAAVTPHEIQAALFSIDKNKSPGVDGYSSGFFRDAWAVIGYDFTAAVQEFFQKSTMPRAANSTLIALIPKSDAPKSVSDFRPISCYTVFYKTVSKVLANRMKLASKYTRSLLTPRCILKVDIKKAFDSVNWSFLSACLLNFGFPEQFKKWVLACVTSSHFSLNINGSSEGFFPGKRGLRQGDPLSPYLFALCMEAVDRCLNLFAMYSGLKANPMKSSLFFGGVAAPVKELILSSTGYVEGEIPVRYLGIPLFSSRLTRTMFSPLLDKIRDRIGH
ncbi:hypothetical protein RND81_06G108500 [Saponaria officinalis]|uniref:Reverse transcriptase domain-containing protein n=1 Tax=Saponaria officinalis TaxID=3572 RepID=A0AAW1K957_SAPOF